VLHSNNHSENKRAERRYKPSGAIVSRQTLYLIIASGLLLLGGCGPAEDEGSDYYDADPYYYDADPYNSPNQELTDLPPPPRIAGIWSGTWEGIDSSFGPAAGTWVARVSQKGSDIDGPISFGGDIDCAEGDMTGFADAQTQEVSGQVFRDPCPFNDWHFSAFNQQKFIASGNWEKQSLSNGTFEGRRIATFTGPEISHVYPPAARAGDYVTIIGKRLTMIPGVDALKLGENGISITPTEATDTMIRVQLPATTGSSDQLVLTTAGGKAFSPRVFNTTVGNPQTNFKQKMPLANNSMPYGVATSVNGRRAYVANWGNGTVSMINTEMGREWTSTVVFPGPSPAIRVHAIAVDPDGRSIYIAGHNMVGIVHAHTLEVKRTIPVPASGTTNMNVKGIAISPDGRWLLISEAVPGGRVTILDLDNNFSVANTLQMAGGNTPKGIAVNPNNTHAYIAVSGDSNEIQVYNLSTQSLEPPIVIGAGPSAVAVTSDGRRIYAISYADASISSYDLISGATDESKWGSGELFRDVAITPDGRFIYVTTNLRLLVFDTSFGINSAAIHEFTSQGASDAPYGVAFTPNGKRAYITLQSSDEVVEIGNQRTLRISKQGGGIGQVRTAIGEINCGASCMASFDAGSQIVLSATVTGNDRSYFDRWNGDADCSDGRVSMNSNVFCVAVFKVRPPTTSSGGSSSGGGSSGGGSGSSSCFIATAAYGSWLDPHVLTLRQFRDDHLLTNMIGTWFVGVYYRHSPPIASFIREHESLRILVRYALAPVVYAIEYPAVLGLLLILIVLLRMRRKQRSVVIQRILCSD
jgi:DNA-binding beta-propeller fold protein YncE